MAYLLPACLPACCLQEQGDDSVTLLLQLKLNSSVPNNRFEHCQVGLPSQLPTARQQVLASLLLTGFRRLAACCR